jgi:prepilin-type N-terminal cleavage/methylation domain-containing protein
LKNCKGFTLVEVITALMVLTIMTLVLLPSLAKIYQERGAIHQEHVALHLLDKAITSWIYDNNTLIEENVVIEQNTTYTLTLLLNDDNYIRACINWIGANQRVYERCESGKK